jgi:hypothetical protein
MKLKRKAKKTKEEALDQVVTTLVKRSRPAREPFGMKGEPIEPEYIGVTEAQVLSGISKWTWRQLAYRREIESIKVGTRLLLPLCEVRRVIEEGRRTRADGLPAGVPSRRASNGRTGEAGETTNA